MVLGLALNRTLATHVPSRGWRPALAAAITLRGRVGHWEGIC